jgi:hypothetical protein
MTDTPTTPATPDEEPTAEELASAAAMRPLDQLPSPWVVKGEPALISAPTLEALSPADRQSVLSRAGSNDPKAINAALNSFLRGRQQDVRIRCGPGEGATATEREALDQMNQLRLMTEEYHKLEAELAEVREHRTEYDASGKPVPVPVYVLQGSLRSARQARMAEIGEHMSLVAGIQGEAELKRAARADALHIRKVRSEIADRHEIKRRAHNLVREERLNEAARTQAKFLKGNLG